MSNSGVSAIRGEIPIWVSYFLHGCSRAMLPAKTHAGQERLTALVPGYITILHVYSPS